MGFGLCSISRCNCFVFAHTFVIVDYFYHDTVELNLEDYIILFSGLYVYNTALQIAVHCLRCIPYFQPIFYLIFWPFITHSLSGISTRVFITWYLLFLMNGRSQRALIFHDVLFLFNNG